MMSALVLTGALTRAASAAGAKSATVTGIVRNLEVKRAASPSWSSASVWMPLAAGDEVRTFAQGRASFLLAGGGQVKMDENSHARFDPGGVHVLKGKVWYSSQKTPGRNITTPTAVAALEGTEVVAEVDESGSRFKVVEGSVTLRNDRGEVRVPASRESSAAGAAAPRLLGTFDAGQLAWVKLVEDYRRLKEESDTRLTALGKEFERFLGEAKSLDGAQQNRRLEPLVKELNGEIKRFGEIDMPDAFTVAHRHRLMALQYMSLALRSYQARVLGQDEGYGKKAAFFFNQMKAEGVKAEALYRTFQKAYDAVTKE